MSTCRWLLRPCQARLAELERMPSRRLGKFIRTYKTCVQSLSTSLDYQAKSCHYWESSGCSIVPPSQSRLESSDRIAHGRSFASFSTSNVPQCTQALHSLWIFVLGSSTALVYHCREISPPSNPNVTGLKQRTGTESWHPLPGGRLGMQVIIRHQGML